MLHQAQLDESIFFYLPASKIFHSISGSNIFPPQASWCGYLGNIEVLSEEGCLLDGGLPALIGQDVAEGLQSVLWLAQREGLPTDGEVDVVLSQGPALLPVHLHGLAVAPQRVPPLKEKA